MLAKVNADEEKKLAQDYEVTGYPTLKVFRQGKASDYKGSRNQWGKLIIYTFCAIFFFPTTFWCHLWSISEQTQENGNVCIQAYWLTQWELIPISMFHVAIRSIATPPLDGMLVHCNLTLPSAFHQSSLTVYWYPFTLLGEERHCENLASCPKNTVHGTSQVWTQTSLPDIVRDFDSYVTHVRWWVWTLCQELEAPP